MNRYNNKEQKQKSDGRWNSNRKPTARHQNQHIAQNPQEIWPGPVVNLKYDTSWPPNTTNSSQHDIWQEDTLASAQQFPTPPPTEPPPPVNRSIYALQTRPGYGITVTPYNPCWPGQFSTISSHLRHLFTTSNPPAAYKTIEHIGSTSIPGLAAKPNIDVLVTFPDHAALEAGIDALEWEIPDDPPYTRYTRVPNGGGIQGRESFKLYVPETSAYYLDTPERSVYLIEDSERNHAGRVQIRCYRAVKDTLSDPANGDLLKEYADVKLELASRVYDDSITYSRLKDAVVRKVLRRAGWVEKEIDEKEKLSERVWIRDHEPAY